MSYNNDETLLMNKSVIHVDSSVSDNIHIKRTVILLEIKIQWMLRYISSYITGELWVIGKMMGILRME